MTESVEPVKRATIRALLLAGALAAGEGPAVGQAIGVRAAPVPAAPRGDAIPSHGVRSSDGEGRRDPFVDPFRRSGSPAAGPRPSGLAGIAAEEMTLRGIVLLAGAYVAVVETGNGRSHLLRGGETLFDGSVRSVTAGGVLIVRRDRGGPAAPGGRTVMLTFSPATHEQ